MKGEGKGERIRDYMRETIILNIYTMKGIIRGGREKLFEGDNYFQYLHQKV